ncbi:UDP-GlcNAc:betaGal beta-1,3-N-acetylglucosaminyltransferase-like protein [Asbolus verrucosus]|uniref:UDP-GlcNAc:betaGal beta-1,3-N-acetylglucosaminyltransferase-like protein n=1 Tax=Asbolus verrucosus TaxID=1661398 RepID=A0A482WAX9_ASBVE|nr:UDP-GlcNAc:betaGal beta-1,3-N-acetylglucosaminyltransferase-like protein [Asbolus verrucosus]
MNQQVLISVIVPIYNGSPWIDQCFQAILQQKLTSNFRIEICVCDDASTDNTAQMLVRWKKIFEERGVPLKTYNNESGVPKGVGYSKNKAVNISSGAYLCFQDVDDLMLPTRILEQFERAEQLPNNTIIGSQFKRTPENSTQRYTQWANSLSARQLHDQIYTSHGPTVIMPTWFCHRSVFERSTIWNVRLKRLENVVLSKWKTFTIWNAGKQGRKLYNSLSEENQRKVAVLCDVDHNKIGKKYVSFCPETRRSGRPVDIVHFKDASPPFVICVKMNLTKGEFEDNLNMLHLTEDIDYVMFS